MASILARSQETRFSIIVSKVRGLSRYGSQMKIWSKNAFNLVIFIAALVGILSYLGIGPFSAKNKKMGNYNTILNSSSTGTLGDGNTIVGPTDNNGNTIYNTGGTAIGFEACAGTSSVAIGAYSNAGSCIKK